MRDRRFTFAVGIAIAVAAVSLAWVPLAGQTAAASKARTPAAAKYTPPRTTDGQPDLSGVWANNSATPLERPKEFGDRAFLTDEEVGRLQRRANEIFGSGADAAFGDDFFKAALAADSNVADRSFRSFDKVTGNYSAVWIVGRDFDKRTSLITDPPGGRIPALTPAAQARQGGSYVRVSGENELDLGKFDGFEDRPLSERCITFGFPDTLAGYNSYYQIVQSPGYVAIYTERIHDTRIIPLDGRPHVAPGVHLWLGDSRGRWEGDTLVVDTTNFSARSAFLGATESLHLIERFTRVGPTTINYEFRVEDPATWTKPWTVMIPLKHSSEHIYEYACHEGNSALTGVLAGARVQEKSAVSTKQQ